MGYSLGKIKGKTNKDKIYIHKGDNTRVVNKQMVEFYLEDGWQKGKPDYLKTKGKPNYKNKNKFIYNNGVIEKRFNPDIEIIPEGFTKGRLLEYRNKLSETMKDKYKDLSYREYWLKRNRESVQSEEYRKKHSEISKKKWTEESYRNKVMLLSKEGCNKPEVREFRSKYLKNRWDNDDNFKYIGKHKFDSKETLAHKLALEHETKKKNNSFNSSKVEDSFYNDLCLFYGKENIIRQYRDDRYPFNCDFYIKSKDLFIELNLSWTHGGRPYDPNDKECQEKLAIWQEKAKNSAYYVTAIHTWTNLDIRKRDYISNNNLNIDIIYNKKDLYNYIERLSKE